MPFEADACLCVAPLRGAPEEAVRAVVLSFKCPCSTVCKHCVGLTVVFLAFRFALCVVTCFWYVICECSMCCMA